MKFSPGFKARMVQRMAGPEGISASALSREIGVPQPTLSRWLKEARNLEAMKKKAPEKKKAVRPAHRWTPEEKFQVVIRAAQLPEDQLARIIHDFGKSGLSRGFMESVEGIYELCNQNPIGL